MLIISNINKCRQSIGFKRVAEEIKLSYRYAIWCMRIKEKKIAPLQVTYEILIIAHF